MPVCFLTGEERRWINMGRDIGRNWEEHREKKPELGYIT